MTKAEIHDNEIDGEITPKAQPPAPKKRVKRRTKVSRASQWKRTDAGQSCTAGRTPPRATARQDSQCPGRLFGIVETAAASLGTAEKLRATRRTSGTAETFSAAAEAAGKPFEFRTYTGGTTANPHSDRRIRLRPRARILAKVSVLTQLVFAWLLPPA